MTTPIRITLLATLALLALPAGAASITLQPSQAIVQQGASFTVDLLLDALDAPGSHPGMFGGQVVIDYDPALLQFTGFDTSLHLFEPVTEGTSGTRKTVTFGFDNATDNGLVGRYGFKAIGSPQQIATLGVQDADDFMGTFISYLPTYKAFYPGFTGTSVQIAAVPLPAGAWMALTALGAAATRLRRRSRQESPATR
ncbi:MAG: hypothetical protein HRU81_11305 [Gammaproteobacteria bacterium]|nr:MAG: hypothetical protein HRU81_11305 [Gammaproteobacteria bacterium]